MKIPYKSILFAALLAFSILSQSQTSQGIDMDRLFQHMLYNRNVESGGIITAQERYYFTHADEATKNSEEYRQRKNTALYDLFNRYESDKKAHPDKVYTAEQVLNDFKSANKDLTVDLSTESVQTAKKQAFNGMRRKGVSTAELTAKTPEIVAGKKQGLLSKIMGRGGKLFAVGDYALWVALGYSTVRDEGIANDLSKMKCPDEADETYTQFVMLENVEVQKQILKNCTTPDLKNKIAAVRKNSKGQFSAGKASCKIENGQGRVEALSQHGTKQVLFFSTDGKFEKMHILPQNQKYNGSFLEYKPTGKDEGTVRYTGIRSKNPESMETNLERAQFEDESVLSFASRIDCTLKGCTSETEGAYPHIKVSELPGGVSPAKPFGDIQANSEFFVQSAKTLGVFRQGLEQNFDSSMSFKDVCASLGAEAPTVETATAATPKKKQPPQEEATR